MDERWMRKWNTFPSLRAVRRQADVTAEPTKPYLVASDAAEQLDLIVLGGGRMGGAEARPPVFND